VAKKDKACEYAARFFDDEDRKKVIDLLLKLKQTGTSEAFAKAGAAEVLSALLKLDPKRADPEFKAVLEKAARSMFESFIFFLDEELVNFYELQYEHVRNSAAAYLPSLITVLLFDAGFEEPYYTSSLYHGQPIGRPVYPSARAQMLFEDLPNFSMAKLNLAKLLERVQKKYDEWGLGCRG
jgi:hypothetical protein